MSIDPSFSVAVSFVGFCWIFFKKVYPVITQKLDEHIESVKQKILEAENLKDDACSVLKNAYRKKDDIEKIIEENRKKSEEKIERLRQENEEELQNLRKRYEDAVKAQAEAAFVKQKSLLIEKLSDLIIERLTEKIKNSGSETDIMITKEDLKKLM